MNGCIQLSRKDGQGKVCEFYISGAREIELKHIYNEGKLGVKVENDILWITKGNGKLPGKVMGFFIDEDKAKLFKNITKEELKVEFGFPTEGLFDGCSKEELGEICNNFRNQRCRYEDYQERRYFN